MFRMFISSLPFRSRCILPGEGLSEGLSEGKALPAWSAVGRTTRSIFVFPESIFVFPESPLPPILPAGTILAGAI